jgi:endonuclease/exonuclease/phosphatase family metal-dependent hydrolase
VRIVTYNSQFGVGRDKRCDLARTVAAVRDADIIALQEIERFWRRSGNADQPAEIADMLPDRHWVYGPYFDADGSLRAADGSLINRRRQFGVMILSRWPIISSRLHVLPKHRTVKTFNMIAGMLEAVIDAPGGPLRVYAVHLNDVTPSERLAQIARLFEVLNSAPLEGGVWSGYDPEWQAVDTPPPMPQDAVVLGDFNSVPRSPEYEAIVGPFDPDFGYGRVDVHHRLIDAWVATGHGESDGVTYPHDPGRGYSQGYRIDYCFVTAGLLPRLSSCWIDGDAPGSDHQPVWIELAV